MPEAVQYVRDLADRIGPRPATTDAEAEAADYIQETMTSYGLEVERQEFDCPRTYGWAYVLYHALTVIAAGSLFWADVWGPLRWIAFVLAALVAFTMWMDLDTRWGLSGWLPPKGPSQNIIARHVPRVRRGERHRRVVIVAHYDSAVSSLAFAPSMVKNFASTFGLMKWCTFLVPLLILLDNLPVFSFADPYVRYVTWVLAAYLLVPLLINVHREVFGRPTDGANDNASGVAAMLGVIEQFAADFPESVSMSTQPIERVPGAVRPKAPGEEMARESAAPMPAVGPEMAEEGGGGVLEYSPAGAPDAGPSALPDDFEWAEAPPRPGEGQKSLEFETIEFDAIAPETPPAADSSWGELDTDFDGDGVADRDEPARRSAAPDDLDDWLPAESAPAEKPAPPQAPARPERAQRKGFFGRMRKKEREGDVGDWLGVEKGFDARQEGRRIGSWESFDDDDDDGFGLKGGWAGDDPIGDPEFAANEASRIRKRITERIDHSLSDKEVWFVATGAEEAGTWGMRAFIEEYATDLKGAHIINLDNIGAGTLHWVTREGMARRYRSDRRLIGAARRVSREEEILVKGREYRGLSTDATPALARGLKAMSIMAFDVNGRLPNWHWHTDTSDNVIPENLDNAIRLVMGIVRDI